MKVTVIPMQTPTRNANSINVFMVVIIPHFLSRLLRHEVAHNA